MRTTALMQAFIPGLSPPDVKTPICFIAFCAITLKQFPKVRIQYQMWKINLKSNVSFWISAINNFSLAVTNKNSKNVPVSELIN